MIGKQFDLFYANCHFLKRIIMKQLFCILIILFISPMSFADDEKELKPLELLLKVKYVDLENGFYGFETLEGQKYLPTNMPDSFKQDGLPIKIIAERQPNMLGFQMWGEYIRIMSIQVIDCEEFTDETTDEIKAICKTVD
jgi:hypothetical protein